MAAASGVSCINGTGGLMAGTHLPLTYQPSGAAGFGDFTVLDGGGHVQAKGDTLGVTLWDASGLVDVYESGAGLGVVHGNLTTTP